MKLFKIEHTEDGSTTWLNLDRLFQIYIDKPTNKVLAYRTKTEVEHYRVTDDTLKALEDYLETQATASRVLSVFQNRFFNAKPPTPEPPQIDEPTQPTND